MSNQANINKQYAINKSKEAIKNAEELLKVEGEETAYYAWHHQTIEVHENLINDVLNAPITDWN